MIERDELYMLNEKNRLVMVLLLLISFISIGYAVLSRNLNIIGLTSVKNNKWNIYFDNVIVNSGKELEVITPATIGESTTNLEFKVVFDEPGQVYSFDVDVVNNGTIDAMISLIESTTLTEEQRKYLDYSIAYKDGTSIEEYNLLKKDDRDTFRVKVEFIEDISEEDLPKADTEINLSINLKYVQRDESGSEREYRINFDSNGGVEAIPSSVIKKLGEEIGDEYYNAFEANALPLGYLYSEDFTKELISDSQSPTGIAYRIKRNQDGTRTAGYYWSIYFLPVGEPYYMEIIAKGTGVWHLGQEQGGQTIRTLTDSYTVYSRTYSAIASSYCAFTIYNNYPYDAGSYIDIASAKVVHLLPETTRDGYTFTGWYTEKDGGERITNTTKVTKNTTYYAHWTKK